MFGIEASQAAQYVIAFAIILVLVALFGLVLRRLTGGRLMMPHQERGRSRQPRLGIVDIYDLDRQRQLILLRRDNVEHLLLVGGPNDVVIETNIVRVAGARLPPAPTETLVERTEPPFERAPEAATPRLEGQRPSIEAQLAARLGAMIGRSPQESDAEEEPAPVARTNAPAQGRPEPVLKPDGAKLAAPPVEPPTRPEPVLPIRPAPGTAPVFPPGRPAPAGMPPASMPAMGAFRPEPSRPAPAPSARPEPRGPDAAILSDMAKQLEEALKRPPAPMPIEPEQEEEDDLLEKQALVQETPTGPAAPKAPSPPVTPSPVGAPEPPRPAVGPVRPVPPSPPQPVPPPVRSTSKPEPAPAPPPRPAAADDPFSVEAIEAEFARLLGRPPGKEDKAG